MTTWNSFPLFFILSALHILLARAEPCYYPDGFTTSPDMPCNQSAVDVGGHTSCCNELAMCLDNGLCLGEGIISRGSCTDQDWGEACPQWCKTENPSGGMPLTPCDIFDVTFACNVNDTACKDAYPPFHVHGGNGVILRGPQVAALEASGSSVALHVDSTTTLMPVQYSKDATTEVHTVTATPLSSSGTFTVADLAGAAAGVGTPLLLALVGAIILIMYQRRKLKETMKLVEERERFDREAFERLRTIGSEHSHSPATPYGSTPHAAAPRYGRFQEVDSNAIKEMGNSDITETDGRAISEMDAGLRRIAR